MVAEALAKLRGKLDAKLLKELSAGAADALVKHEKELRLTPPALNAIAEARERLARIKSSRAKRAVRSSATIGMSG